MIPILAAISGESLMWLVIEIIVGGLIFWLITWALAQMGLPDPFQKIARVVLVLAVVVFLINALMTIGGHGFIVWR